MQQTRFLTLILLFFFAPFLTNCEFKTRTAEYAQLIDPPENAHPAPIKFSKLRTQMPLGKEIGSLRNECIFTYHKAGQSTLSKIIDQTTADNAFAQALELQGYDVVNQLTADFDEDYIDDIIRSEYKISAKIIDADIEACHDMSKVILDKYLSASSGYRGKLYLKVQWAVYDNLRRATVYRTQSDGYYDLKDFNIEGLDLMMAEAFAMAAHNLGTDPHFHDLIFYGIKPPPDWKKLQKENHQRPRLYNPQESVALQNPPLFTQPLKNHIEQTQRVAVLISGGASHGSGYFISKQGHILTNNHVVGNALRVRVETAGKKEKLIAEVLRTDKARDVALLKLEKMPDDLNIVTLPIRTEWPKVSEEIYALGAPQMRKLRDTLSKGIVSAHRKNYRIFGTKMDFLQGDVSVHGGNSGGPLLDAHGNIIGMTVAGHFFNDYKANDALNLFIPIGDALDKLGIELE